MKRVPVCKCCGFPVVNDGIDVVLTPLQRRVFHLVKRAGSAGINSRDALGIIYQDDPTGGPDSSNIVAVVCNQMNKRLEQFGLKIAGRRGPGGYVALQKLERARVAKR